MTFINWTDSEEMLGLLAEYVADERSEAQGDSQRLAFLNELAADLSGLSEQFDDMSTAQVADALREIRRAQNEDFAADPVLLHVDGCIDELTRIAGG